MTSENFALKLTLEMFLYDMVACIDEDRLEDWVECFLDDGIYEVHSKENRDRRLGLPLMACSNKNMILDRVTALRRGNIYALHSDRHCLSNLRTRSQELGDYLMQANYCLYHTDLEGVTRLFSVGTYETTIALIGALPKIRRHVVTVDTFAVVNHIATPI